MNKFDNVPPELVERVLENVMHYELYRRREGYEQILSDAYELRKAMQPQEYLLFGKIPVQGEPPLKEKPSNPKEVVFMLNCTCGYVADWADRTRKSDYGRGIVFATEQGAQAAAKALGWCEEDEIHANTEAWENRELGADEEFVKVSEEKPAFKVGDKVKTHNETYSIEKTGVIEKYIAKYDLWLVNFNNGFQGYFKESELELVEGE